MALQRLNTEADKAVALARAAKRQVRAAKARLKRVRKLAKQLKRAAKQARNKAEVARLSALTTPVPDKARKVLKTPRVPRVRAKPVKRVRPVPSAAAVAQSVIRQLDEEAKIPPKPEIFPTEGV
jgi:hypothetical protein